MLVDDSFKVGPGGHARPASVLVRLTRLLGVALFGLVGLILLVGGVRLIFLGGSIYYLVAGLMVGAVAILLFRRDRRAPWLYTAFSVLTLLWALYETGLETWGLLPRLAMPLAMGLWFVLPVVRRGLTRGALHWERVQLFLPLLLMLAGVILVVGSFRGFSPADHASISARPIDAVEADDEWHAFGNSERGDRFSAAGQITPANVGTLRQAWVYRTGDNFPNFESTPLKVGDSLIICTAAAVISIDADSGKQNWRYDPGVDSALAPAKLCRGVSYYAGTHNGQHCDARLFWPTVDDRLHAIDVNDGRPCTDFGQGGSIDLSSGVQPSPPGYHFTTSPPAIVGDRLVIGSFVFDNQSTDEPSGVVRAFDVRSGRLLWGWEGTQPKSRKGLAPGETFARSTPNVWSVISADSALGLVYLPTGNSTPDYFGGHRTTAQDRYSSSIVALDVATGDVRWSFQTVHHDLWDMDIPAQPVLVDLDTPAGKRPALIAPTKRGEIFVLDRRDGKPIVPVSERPVPGGPAPGDRLSPTQPYTVGFPSFGPPKLAEHDMWGATMIDQMLCRITFREQRYEGQFTPPSLQGSLGYPDVFGVLNWGSVAVDPERQIMFVNASYMPYLTRLMLRSDADAMGIVPYGTPVPPQAAAKLGKAAMHGDWPYAQAGTPYAVKTRPFLSQLGLPCHQPPWGKVAAVDLRTRKILWERPFGTTRDSAPFGMPLPMGVFSMGGAVVTRSGVAFIGAAIDNYLRAYDIQTGRELWKGRLPAGGQANPITYVSRRTGRQYVVIAAGGHAGFKTTPGDHLVAYALPQ